MHKLLNWKVLLLPIAFFVMSICLINDYGISWDEPIHWHRGHAYLHYFLTGNTNFEDLPKIADYTPKYEGYISDGNEISLRESKVRRSYYQHDSLTMDYFLENDSGHPPLNDILAAFTNHIFYQKTNLLGDIAAHHLFNIIASAILVFVVVAFGYQTYGILPGIVAGTALIAYPLFFAESQFNIKDPPQAAFFALAIWSFWNSTHKGSWKWLLIAIIATGISFGMKFNILFMPFMLLPFLAFKLWPFITNNPKKLLTKITKVPKLYLALLILSPIIVAIVFVLPWPYLWQDPINNFLEIFGYYKEIGTGNEAQHAYIGFGPFNLYPIYWIAITTPVYTLALSIIGILFAVKNWKKHNYVSIVWLAWLVVPIMRVTIPGSSIYGGIRQIFEYIPALALFAGIGAYYLVDKFKNSSKLATFSVFILFIPNLISLAALHPNQNVFFNSLIGGLKGAHAAQVPYNGNSFGNAYWQALQWLNENAENGAELALIQGTALNIPRIMLREDIKYWNDHWSGILRRGEYLLELTHDDPVRAYPYAWDYVEKILDPVYQVEVDGVAIAKIWKNDLEHTKDKYKVTESEYTAGLEVETKESTILLSFESVVLSSLNIKYLNSNSCVAPSGFIEILDREGKWHKESENIGYPQISGVKGATNEELNFYFPAREARALKLNISNPQSCIFNSPKIVLKILD